MPLEFNPQLNISLLQDVKYWVMKNPRHFDMNNFVLDRTHTTEHFDCGTCFCIAGLVNSKTLASSYGDTINAAEQLFGCWNYVTHDLFYLCNWQEEYRRLYDYGHETLNPHCKVAAFLKQLSYTIDKLEQLKKEHNPNQTLSTEQ